MVARVRPVYALLPSSNIQEPQTFYERIILQDYFPRLGHQASDITGALQPPRSWHGSPMAALMRTFLILGSPVVGRAITKEQGALLRKLQDLHLRPDPVPQLPDSRGAVASGLAASVTTRTPEPGTTSTRPQSTQRDSPDTLRVGQDTHAQGTSDSAADVETVGYQSVERPLKRFRDQLANVENRWSWGPASSSEDKAVWLPRMMGYTAC